VDPAAQGINNGDTGGFDLEAVTLGSPTTSDKRLLELEVHGLDSPCEVMRTHD
jgi:hypothetical protein